jgi:hypothetical protein
MKQIESFSLTEEKTFILKASKLYENMSIQSD